jgi:hypothetical protein
LSLHMAKKCIVQAHQPHVPPTPFKVGSHIWLDAQHLKIKSKLQKLNLKHLRLFKVLDRVGDLDYRLELPPTMDLHNVFHANRLICATINKTYRKLPQPNCYSLSTQIGHKTSQSARCERDHAWNSKVRRLHMEVWEHSQAGQRVREGYIYRGPWFQIRHLVHLCLMLKRKVKGQAKRALQHRVNN